MKRAATLIALFMIKMVQIHGQVIMRGSIYDRTMINGLPNVTISDSRGPIALSDSSGHYSIKVALQDTIFFSYLNKQTIAFPVKEISDPLSFNVSIDVVSPVLQPVYVNHNSYYVDSLLNRQANRAGFDYRQGSYVNRMHMMPGGKGIMLGVGLDLEIFLDRDLKRSKEIVQRWLIAEEQDKYIDHRFSRTIVRKITGLDSADLTLFMQMYRPTYEFTKSCATEWEFYKYIQEWGKSFMEESKK